MGFSSSLGSLLALIGAEIIGARGSDLHHAFYGSSLYIAGMLCTAALGVFPYVLPSNGKYDYGLTVYSAHAARYGLGIGLWW